MHSAHKIAQRLQQFARRIALKHRERQLRRDIRRCHAQAERHRDLANYYEGEIMPALCMDLINTLEQARGYTHPACKPALGQARNTARSVQHNLRMIQGGAQ